MTSKSRARRAGSPTESSNALSEAAAIAAGGEGKTPRSGSMSAAAPSTSAPVPGMAAPRGVTRSASCAWSER